MIEYVECRTLGHGWEPKNTSARDDKPGTVALVVRCMRCGTTRRDWNQNTTGELASRSYDYPTGYRTAKEDTPTRSELRLHLALIKRKAKRTTKTKVPT